MDKYLVDIYYLGTLKHYDFWISKHMNIRSSLDKIIEEIRLFENNPKLFLDEEKVMIYSKRSGLPLGYDMTLFQSGIRSGDTLYII